MSKVSCPHPVRGSTELECYSRTVLGTTQIEVRGLNWHLYPPLFAGHSKWWGKGVQLRLCLKRALNIASTTQHSHVILHIPLCLASGLSIWATFFSLNFCIYFVIHVLYSVCVCVCFMSDTHSVYEFICMFMHVCGAPRLRVGVFLNISPTYWDMVPRGT